MNDIYGPQKRKLPENVIPKKIKLICSKCHEPAPYMHEKSGALLCPKCRMNYHFNCKYCKQPLGCICCGSRTKKMYKIKDFDFVVCDNHECMTYFKIPKKHDFECTCILDAIPLLQDRFFNDVWSIMQPYISDKFQDRPAVYFQGFQLIQNKCIACQIRKLFPVERVRTDVVCGCV